MNQAEALKEDIISRLCAIRIPALRAEALSHTLGVCHYQVKRVGRFHTIAEMDSLRIKDRRT